MTYLASCRCRLSLLALVLAGLQVAAETTQAETLLTSNAELAHNAAVALCDWDYEYGQPTFLSVSEAQSDVVERFIITNRCPQARFALIAIDTASGHVQQLGMATLPSDDHYGSLVAVLPGSIKAGHRLLFFDALREHPAMLVETDEHLDIVARTALPWLGNDYCTYPGQPFYQLRKRSGSAVELMAVRGSEIRTRTLLPIDTKPVLHCGVWGEVTVAWSGQDAKRSTLQVEQMDATLQTRWQRQWKRGRPSAIELLDNAGHTEVRWVTSRGTFQQTIPRKRVVDGTFAGVWYNVQLTGQGLVVDVSRQRGRTVVTANVLTFDAAGQQDWLFMSGVADGSTARLEAFRASGGGIGSNGTKQVHGWGQATLNWEDCDHMTLTVNDERGRDKAVSFERLNAHTAPDISGICSVSALLQSSFRSDGLPSYLPRVWYSRKQGGHGVMLDIHAVQGEATLSMFMTTFSSEHDGRPLWVAASGKLEEDQNVIVLQGLAAAGGRFLETGADPVDIHPVGWIRMDRLGCDRMRLRYQLDGIGQRRELLRPFVPSPMGASATCQR